MHRVIGHTNRYGCIDYTAQRRSQCGLAWLPVIGIGNDDVVSFELLVVLSEEVFKRGRTNLFLALDVNGYVTGS